MQLFTTEEDFKHLQNRTNYYNWKIKLSVVPHAVAAKCYFYTLSTTCTLTVTVVVFYILSEDLTELLSPTPTVVLL